VQSKATSCKTVSNRKILGTVATDYGYCLLMSSPIEARNCHEQQRKIPTRHPTRLSGDLGLVCERLGLIQKLQAVSLKQKSSHHQPQTKVLEFLVAILAGLQHVQDFSLAAHPLEKDQAVALPHRVECSMCGYLGDLPSLW
jgi:hypothetical protein